MGDNRSTKKPPKQQDYVSVVSVWHGDKAATWDTPFKSSAKSVRVMLAQPSGSSKVRPCVFQKHPVKEKGAGCVRQDLMTE